MLKGKKLLIIAIIFVLMFSYFAEITEAIAASTFVSLFTGSQNSSIDFDANFNDTGNEKNFLSDVNNENLFIRFKVKVKEDGYLKNANITIDSNEELNFKIKECNDLEKDNDYIQTIDDNVVTLNKIESTSGEINIDIPIEYQNEEFINLKKLSNTFKASLFGTYIDAKGNENEISKDVELTLAWKDEREINVESEISKFVRYGDNGVILQTNIKVDNSNIDSGSLLPKNTLPVKETNLNIEVPLINDQRPSQISVNAKSTKGTNGKDLGETEFTDENWFYNDEENKIKIHVTNELQKVNIINNEDYSTKEDERYYSAGGVDEYEITYTYNNIEDFDEILANSKVEANVILYSGDVKEENGSTLVDIEEFKYDLSDQTGNIISLDVENNTPNISKIYGYINNGEEVKYTSKTSLNISNTELLQEIIIEDINNFYTEKSNSIIETDDIYYKKISISKQNFFDILGEDGQIEILDLESNNLFTINKEVLQDENDNFSFEFNKIINSVIIKISKPINVGNLIFSTERCISNVGLSKKEYKNISSVSTSQILKAKFDYIEDVSEIDLIEVKTLLDETYTNVSLFMNKESLSTVVTNEDVEFVVGLNNEKVSSDLFGHSIIELEMPEYITGMEITDFNMLYGEDLSLTSVESYVKDNKTFVKIVIDGMQKSINSGVLTNGTNIIFHANIDVEKYIPSLNDTVKIYVFNSEATNYKNEVEYKLEESNKCGYDEYNVLFAAPDGVVAINTISNFNEQNSVITSIKEGKKSGYLDLYSEARTAKMDLTIINNNENSISDFVILGRYPFNEVTDIETGEELGATLDIKLKGEIISAQEGFTVYYSENGEATKDLEDENNAWVIDPIDMEKVKSYLIVPNDSEYIMEAKEVLKFSYQFEIPANLEHDENICSTYLTYYKDNAKDTEETAKPNMVVLTTGNGPKINFTMSSEFENKELKALDDFDIKINVENTGKEIVKNLEIKLDNIQNASYVTSSANRENVSLVFEDGILKAHVDQMALNSSFEITVTLKANSISMYSDDNSVFISSSCTAEGLGKILTQELNNITIKRAELKCDTFFNFEYDLSTTYLEKDTMMYGSTSVRNLTIKDLENVEVVLNFPKEIEVIEIGNENAEKDEKIVKNQNEFSWKIDKLESGMEKTILFEIKILNLEEGITGKSVEITSTAKADNTEVYNGDSIKLNIGKESLEIHQYTTNDTYVNSEDQIEFLFNVKNSGLIQARNVQFIDIIPKGLIVKNAYYYIQGTQNKKSNIHISSSDYAKMLVSIPAECEIEIHMIGKIADMGDTEEMTITNVGTIENDTVGKITSNSVTLFVKNTKLNEKDDNKNDNENNNKENDDSNVDDKNINKTSKITGAVWLDSNRNGMKDNDEPKMPNINIILINSNNGAIQKTTTTNKNGEYTFSGVINGSYLVIFKYDTNIYTTTTYKKQNVESNVNSDAFTTLIEQNGKREDVAITDTIVINNLDVTNIDVGLVEASKFSLSLDNSITKITVQNDEGTKSMKYDNKKLAKYDIPAKYIDGSTVYIEYTITVTNNGDYTGFATELVDYMPDGMIFNSNLNPDWYTGKDGNLYTKALENKELAKGDSAQVKLVLIKQMTNENTAGIISNTAEISKDYNIYGLHDTNSTPANKAQNEDDISTVDAIISVKTGGVVIYTSALIVCIMLGIMGGMIFIKSRKNETEGGE